MIDIIKIKIFPSNVISGVATGVTSKLNQSRKISFFETQNYNSNSIKTARKQLIETIENNKIDTYYFQKQTHSNIVLEIDKYNISGLINSDAIITNEKGILLNVSIADCQAILIFDKVSMSIAAIHSGWKGTKLNIVAKTIKSMIDKYNVIPNNLLVYLSPSASVQNYEVGEEFTEYFANSVIKRDGKFYFDNRKEIISQLLSIGVKKENIESNDKCTIINDRLHSYRRDRNLSGRMSAFIGMSK